MSFENVQIQHGNFTIDRSGSAFYTVDHEAGTLIKKNSSGTVIFTFTIAAPIVKVESLQYDGYYFWTLEKQGEVGFRVRRWEIDASNLVQVVDEFAYINDVINKYDPHALVVEAYADSLDNIVTTTTSTFDVVDGEIIRAGDDIIIGPSTAVGFEGQYNFVSVIDKTDTTITVSPSLSATFNPDDEIVFSRSFFVFNDDAPAGLSGSLYKYRSDNGSILSLNVSNMYANVGAATFFKNKILFVKGGEVIWLSPETQYIFRSQAIDNLTKGRSEYLEAFDLAGHSNTLYRLEQKHVYYNDPFDRWDEEDWDPSFNYNTSSTIPEIYFVSVKAEPPMLHKFDSSIPDPEDLESEITVTVLDQFRTPVLGRVVDLSSTGGPLSSIQETTDANGQVKVTYTANTTVGEVTITADVT